MFFLHFFWYISLSSKHTIDLEKRAPGSTSIASGLHGWYGRSARQGDGRFHDLICPWDLLKPACLFVTLW